jgi:hypothetical protein
MSLGFGKTMPLFTAKYGCSCDAIGSQLALCQTISCCKALMGLLFVGWSEAGRVQLIWGEPANAPDVETILSFMGNDGNAKQVNR